MPGRAWTSENFLGDTLTMAQRLVGSHLVRRYQNIELRGRIVEVEAYHQDNDPAAHSYRGLTPRNAIMFGPAGYLYVYFIYGMHYCMNVVTEEEGVGAAVLIRAIEPLAGVDTMRALRGPKPRDRNLTNGPAKCCKAMAIGPEHNGLCLTSNELRIEEGASVSPSNILTSPRIGITKAVHLPWRFYLADNPHVSKAPANLSTGRLP